MKQILELINSMSTDAQWQVWQELSEIAHEKAEIKFLELVDEIK
jgi:acyl-CoA-binding protein